MSVREVVVGFEFMDEGSIPPAPPTPNGLCNRSVQGAALLSGFMQALRKVIGLGSASLDGEMRNGLARVFTHPF
ncbi:hypothetical protein [Crenobacter oryzisoli]|uniref:hypothetical protein n=1 Tax=Crenobacter oryzisoli TaxID=3056844 RepID=UPI0025AE071D|nr:hypothetical protein [Crenobacter sp. SG2305]